MKRMTLKDLNLIHNKCLNLVRRKPPNFFIFRKLGGYYGLCDYEKDVVELDHRRDVLRTAYHECVHYLYPEWCETQVLYVESRLVNVLSLFDITKFLKYLAIKLYKSELQKKFLQTKKKKRKKKKIYKKNIK